MDKTTTTTEKSEIWNKQMDGSENEGQMMIRLITLISLWQWH